MKTRTLLEVLLGVAVLLSVGVMCVRWVDYYPYHANGHELSANKNDGATIQAEIDSPDFRAKLARAAGVGKWRLRTLNIRLNTRIALAECRASQPISPRITKAVSAYLSCRAGGHSAEYSCEVMMLGDAPPSEKYGFLADIREKTGTIPESFIYQPKTTPESDGGKFTFFAVVDGEVAWEHHVSYHPDGSVNYIRIERADAIEYSPAYTGVIAEVERRLAERMKAEDVQGLGSCHVYWAFKRDLLKEKGIRWRSPSEMNPDTSYD